MSVNAPFKLDTIILPSADVIHELNDSRLAAGIQSLITRPAGHVHPMYRANDVLQPMAEFSTPDLATVLANVPAGGLGFTTGLSCHLKKATQTGSASRASLVHSKIAMTEGLIYWSSLRLPHRGQGQAQVSILAGYDGTNDPFVYSSGIALPGNLTDGLYYGAGPVAINGTAIPGVQEIQVDSGVRVLRAGGESEEYDTFLMVETTEPIVTIRTLEPTNWGSLGLRGTILNGVTGLQFYARHLRTSNAATTNILGQATNGAALPVDSSGQGTSLVTDTLRVECIAASNAVAPLAFTAGIAIT